MRKVILQVVIMGESHLNGDHFRQSGAKIRKLALRYFTT